MKWNLLHEMRYFSETTLQPFPYLRQGCLSTVLSAA